MSTGSTNREVVGEAVEGSAIYENDSDANPTNPLSGEPDHLLYYNMEQAISFVGFGRFQYMLLVNIEMFTYTYIHTYFNIL